MAIPQELKVFKQWVVAYSFKKSMQNQRTTEPTGSRAAGAGLCIRQVFGTSSCKIFSIPSEICRYSSRISRKYAFPASVIE